MTQEQLDYICEVNDLCLLKGSQGSYNATEQHMLTNILQYEISTSGTKSYAVANEKYKMIINALSEANSHGTHPKLEEINRIIGVR